MPEAASIPLQDRLDLNPNTQQEFTQSFRSRLLNSRIGRSVVTTLAAASLYTGIGAANASSAEADTTLVYEVTNTEGGLFSRNSPRMADTPRTVGQGFYDGDRVELLCGVTNGEAVGPYSNNAWHYVRNLSRPQPNSWVPDRNVLSPNAADQLAPGEKECSEQPSPIMSVQNNPNPPGLWSRTQQQEETNWAIPVRPDNKATGGQTPQSGSSPNSTTFDRMGSCRGAFWGVVQEVCVYGEMGRKDDYANKKEWIDSVEASTPSSSPGTLEVWGDGFYYKIEDQDSYRWYVGRWLRSGTNVCAAATDKHGERLISCYKIDVE